MRAILIPVDERPTLIEIERESGSHLAPLQKLVGGYIEHLPLAALPGVEAFINEEGKMNGLPDNAFATAVARRSLLQGDWISGPMVIVGETDEQGESTDVPDHFVEFLGQIVPGGLKVPA